MQQSILSGRLRSLDLQQKALYLQQNDRSAPSGKERMLQVNRYLQHIRVSGAL
jgi:hypothetical protein